MTTEPVTVMGVDAALGQWVAVTLVGGRLEKVSLHVDARSFVEAAGDADVIAVDIPIGAPDGAERQAEQMARSLIGPRRSSVFSTPLHAALIAAEYGEALRISNAAWGKGISKQAYGLRHRILDVEPIAREDRRIHEVHPEVSFRHLNGAPLAYSKKTWNGQNSRTELLEAVGVHLPDELEEAGRVPVDDVLDAAAAAWSAHRIATGVAVSLPDPPEMIRGISAAIWY
ncbi:MAG: DUF429 domain-containing protein [Acidimicrobiia bacterium]|nr:DUF429 domain-containing protein [Acidimicrobiia bacterium]